MKVIWVLLLPFAAGVLAGRAWVLLPVWLAWGLVFVGYRYEWWGDKTESWDFAIVWAAIVSTAMAGLGIAVRQLNSRRSARRG